MIPPGPASLPDGSAMPGSRAMKNGSSGSAIASATPVSRAVSPDREMPVTSMPSRSATGPTSSTATAHANRPSPWPAIRDWIAAPSAEPAASSASATASSSR